MSALPRRGRGRSNHSFLNQSNDCFSITRATVSQSLGRLFLNHSDACFSITRTPAFSISRTPVSQSLGR
eukprot:4874932-Pleurochrysis_carterae.AAC.1